MATKKSPAAIQKAAQAAIGGPGNKPKRFLIYGKNKKGKTTFGSTAPKVLILDPEFGTEELDPKKFAKNIWPIQKWEDINDAYKFLRSGNHPYEWVHVDGLTRINNMALRYVMKQAEERDLERKPGIVDRRDYGKSGELMKGMLFNFHALNMGVVYTAQERQDTPGEFDSLDEDTEEVTVRYVPDLPQGVRGAVNAIVNGIGRIYTVKVDGKVERRLYLEQTDQLDTGFRSDHELPQYLTDPTIPRLLEIIKTGTIQADAVPVKAKSKKKAKK